MANCKGHYSEVACPEAIAVTLLITIHWLAGVGTLPTYPKIPGCMKIVNFMVYHSHDFAIYTQTSSSIVYEGLTLVDNELNILPLIYSPNPLGHSLSNKSVELRNSYIVSKV